MLDDLFFQYLLQSARPLIGLLFAVALEFVILLCQVEGRENGDLEGIGGVGLSSDVSHARIDLFRELPNIRFRDGTLQNDRVFLIIDFDIDRSRSRLRQRSPQ